MRTVFNILLYSALMLLLTCCTHREPDTYVTDIDGNTYRTCTIGNKVWMAANLRVTRYRNGDPVPMITAPSAWRQAATGAWCYYNNDSSYNAGYGKLYNWHAVNDARSIAPEGWHIPTHDEINVLITELEKDGSNAAKLQRNGLGGYRFYDGNSFHTMGFNGYWWGAHHSFEIYDWGPRLFTGMADVQRNRYEAGYGMAIRCVKD